MYYRRRYRRKRKFKKFDVHVLEYTEEDLKNKVLAEYNIDQLPDCKKCGAIGAKRIVRSGPYGIYIKCLDCDSNVGISVKHNPKDHYRFKSLEEQINQYHSLIPKIKKNYNSLMKILKKEEEEINKFYEKARKEYENKLKIVEMEIEKIRLKRKTMVLESKNKGFFTSWMADGIFIRDATVAEGQGVYDVVIDPRNEKKYKELLEEEKVLYPKVRELYERSSNPEMSYTGSYDNNYKTYYEKIVFSDEDLKKIRGKHFEEVGFLANIKSRNPNVPEELAKIEQEYYNPLVHEKSEIEKMMKKIFKTSNSYIYVLYNNAMPKLYKVGWTERSPTERAQELSATTGIPEPFGVVYQEKTNKNMEIEKVIHKKLDKFRHRGNKEFFKTNLKTIKKAIKESLNSTTVYDEED